mmetsp:Transcript_15071/g.37534  ORF Transcript_15071/g.37534 Transcript_15071/m.37534 type:complete len:299 (-) Transcript_15071:540-1436(-)
MTSSTTTAPAAPSPSTSAPPTSISRRPVREGEETPAAFVLDDIFPLAAAARAYRRIWFTPHRSLLRSSESSTYTSISRQPHRSRSLQVSLFSTAQTSTDAPPSLFAADADASDEFVLVDPSDRKSFRTQNLRRIFMSFAACCSNARKLVPPAEGAPRPDVLVEYGAAAAPKWNLLCVASFPNPALSMPPRHRSITLPMTANPFAKVFRISSCFKYWSILTSMHVTSSRYTSTSSRSLSTTVFHFCTCCSFFSVHFSTSVFTFHRVQHGDSVFSTTLACRAFTSVTRNRCFRFWLFAAS